MPLYLLPDDLPVFPDPRRAERDGMLAIGGGLEPARVLLAYSRGIFPWNGPDEPLTWFCPSPRMVVELPDGLHVPRSLSKARRRRAWRVTLDTAFAAVMAACAAPRDDEAGTWITPGITAAFAALHRAGVAHSVEVWDGEALVGGLYGLAIGAVFCGESMFARQDDASKVGFVALARQLARWGFETIDCQVATEHLRRLGGRELELEAFLARLAAGTRKPGRLGPWRFDADAEWAAPAAGVADG
ncbi:MAG: leucyl/phenylalanyl-tRNA--protein transferase [Myxococcales bacterium]|nr:leucyl/phenylalanyl-tRNA--protein transferase [Myxococcales bacterium]